MRPSSSAMPMSMLIRSWYLRPASVYSALNFGWRLERDSTGLDDEVVYAHALRLRSRRR